MSDDETPASIATEETPARTGPGVSDTAGSLAEPVPEPDALVLELRAGLDRIHRELAEGNERAAARERVIDRLHEENQRMRMGERQLVLRPVLTDLQRLRNDLLREATAVPADLAPEKVADLLRSFAASVELTLERGGVLVVRPEPGAAVDPNLHRVVATVPGSVEQDGTIAEVVSEGYRDALGNQVLAPAAVRVFRTDAAVRHGQPTVTP